MNKTAILYISDSLKQRFGVTSVIMNYFRNIDKSQIQIDFLVFEDSEKEIIDEIKLSGSSVYFMPKVSVKNMFKVISFFKKFFSKNRNYKIVHSHFNQIDMLVFPIAKRFGVKHCISHSHNTKYSDYKLRAIRNWLMCLPLKYIADTWAACGVEAGKFLYGKNFMKSSKHLIINNAINIDKFKYDKHLREIKRKELKINDEILIGNVGSCKKQKNQEYLLYVFSELLKKKNPNISYKLLIVGDGELRLYLQNLAEKLGISDKVLFLGVRKDISELLQAMDIFMLPSLYEGLPVIGVESQAVSLPCLFSTSITREIDIFNAKFIDLDNVEKWVEEIINLNFDNRENNSDSLISKGFSIRHEAVKLLNFYNNI